MNNVVHFEIHAADPERAAAFYRNIFGWNITKWDAPAGSSSELANYYMVETKPKEEKWGEWGGINGGLLQGKGGVPAEGAAVNAYVCTIAVENIDEMVQKVLTGGGMMALPKYPLVGMGWLAYCKDTEGNIFGMMQTDPNAK